MSGLQLRLGELAERLGLVLEGDADLVVSGVAGIEDAASGDLIYVRTEVYAAKIGDSPARAVVAPEGVDVGGRAALRSSDPGRDFYRAARIFVPEPDFAPGVHPAAHVATDARIDPSAHVAAGCFVGAGAEVGARSVLHPGVTLSDGVRVGSDCVLHARVVVAAAARLGDRVVLQPGVVIGGAGFGYTGQEGGGLAKVTDVGSVWIGDDVEIGANSTVDRGTLRDTRIGSGTKIDNLVQIGHNCVLGENCVVVAQAGIAGSTVLEDGAVVMAQAGVTGHLRIGAGAVVGPRAGVHKDIPAGASMLGAPQRDAADFQREVAALRRLPELLKRVRKLERAREEKS